MIVPILMTVGGIALLIWSFHSINNGTCLLGIYTFQRNKNPILFWLCIIIHYYLVGAGLIIAGIYYIINPVAQ